MKKPAKTFRSMKLKDFRPGSGTAVYEGNRKRFTTGSYWPRNGWRRRVLIRTWDALLNSWTSQDIYWEDKYDCQPVRLAAA